MLSNVGHTIQKMINNAPIGITVNDKTTAVTTNGGTVYQTGLIGGKTQYSFKEVIANENLVGHIIETQATEQKLYLLNSTGTVFEYDYNASINNAVVREIYSPEACCGDKAIKIVSGDSHVLILTEKCKIWGAGDNEKYQLVPQGQCKYDTATEILITDTNLHDNACCGAFTGIYNELLCPVIPKCEKKHNNVTCIKDTKCDILLGYLNLCEVTINPPGKGGVLGVPVFGDVSYVGFLCVDEKGCVSGSVTYTLTRVYIKCGCFLSKITTTDCKGCNVREFNTSSTKEVVLFEARQCPVANTDSCASASASPITGAVQIQGKAGSCAIVNINDVSAISYPEFHYSEECKTIVLDLNGCKTSLAGLCDATICNVSHMHCVELSLDFDVSLDSCEIPKPISQQVELPQPHWTNIFAGSNISVLVDKCNRLYVLGSLHNIRSNKSLLSPNCLEDLLSRTNASVTFPADQLNCGGNRVARNENGGCNKCIDKDFETDLTKFGIQLSFPGDERGRRSNVCDFLNDLKRCNDNKNTASTCEPCDAYIYLNISGDGFSCGSPITTNIGSVTLFNKNSINKLVSQQCPDTQCINASYSTVVEYDLNGYCIDTTDISLEKIVKLDFCNEGPNVNVYLDISSPGGLKFTGNGSSSNVEFTVSASTPTKQFILNYGSILDPVELTNLKYAFSLDAHYPIAKYKNPFNTKIINTYLKGGDHVKFVVSNPKNIRQAITADVPTVFKLNRRIIDIAVGKNNLTALVGGLSCPNELFAIGANCHGELGLGSNETVVCWRQPSRGQFDCQVNRIFAGPHVTFYITQSNSVYAAGQWKCFVNSTTPAFVKSICPSWKIKQISISASHLVLLGYDGCIFGLGDNNVGELGLCHLECVTKPTPLVFFYKLNTAVGKQLKENLDHPMEARQRQNNQNGPWNRFGNGFNNQNNQNNFNGPNGFNNGNFNPNNGNGNNGNNNGSGNNGNGNNGNGNNGNFNPNNRYNPNNRIAPRNSGIGRY